jgi:hypothetical protein
MMGVDPKFSPLSLYYEMRGDLTPEPMNEAMLEGRFFEDAIAQIAGRKHNFEVLPGIGLDAPAEVDRALGGHRDRLFKVIKGGLAMGVLEVKHTFFGGSEEWGDAGSDAVPMRHLYQTVVYDGIMRKDPKKAFIVPIADYSLIAARLHAGTKVFNIPHDKELYEAIQDRAAKFVADVAQGIAPKPRDEADDRIYWLARRGKKVTLTAEHAAWVQVLMQAGEARRKAEADEKSIKHLLWQVMGEGTDAVSEDGRLLFTLGANRDFNEARFALENPEAASKCMVLSRTAVKEMDQKLYDAYMEEPKDPLHQTRVFRFPSAGKKEKKS